MYIFTPLKVLCEEKNEANLVQQSIEADEQSDPMFRRMAAAFDAGGAKGLLLSHLPLAEVGIRWEMGKVKSQERWFLSCKAFLWQRSAESMMLPIKSTT